MFDHVDVRLRGPHVICKTWSSRDQDQVIIVLIHRDNLAVLKMYNVPLIENVEQFVLARRTKWAKSLLIEKSFEAGMK